MMLRADGDHSLSPIPCFKFLLRLVGSPAGLVFFHVSAIFNRLVPSTIPGIIGTCIK
jgi:hypothetical protein